MEIHIHSNNKNRIFWILNISGWYLRLLILYLVVHKDKLPNAESISHYLFLGVLYVFISYILRILYRKIPRKEKSLYYISGIILLYSFVATTVVYILSYLSIPLFFDFNILKDWQSNLLPDSRTLTYNLFNSYISFLLWSFLYFIINITLDWKDDMLEKQKALHLAHEAELNKLRMQVQPHFLFNSLNSIYSLLNDNNIKKTKEMVEELSDFLRFILVNKDKETITLEEEIAVIKHYISIQKIRFENKLHVKFDIDPKTEQYSVANFILQPIVENAIKYGKITKHEPLEILISSEILNKNLLLSVKNSGKWANNSKTKESTNTGLENIRNRLYNTFGSQVSLNIKTINSHVEVLIEIPLN